jgi:hypothetical protein
MCKPAFTGDEMMNVTWLRPDLRNLARGRTQLKMRLMLQRNEVFNVGAAQRIKVTDGTAWVSIGNRDVVAPVGSVIEVQPGGTAIVSAIGRRAQTVVEIYQAA